MIRASVLAMITLVTSHATASPQGDAPAPSANAAEPVVPVNDALARIEDLKKRVSLEPTEAGQRKAADELIAARQLLIRQHADDPRLPFWFADYAEDSFTIALPSGGDVDRVLYGLAGTEPRRRVRALVRDMLIAGEQAERTAKDSLARSGAAALPANLSDRLSQVERPRRIPLLRALAEVLQVEVGEFDSAKRRTLAEAAIARVETLLPELDDRTASVVSRYAGLAAARIEDERSANRLLGLARQKAGEDEALSTLADLAALRAAGLLRGAGPAADAAGLLRGSGSVARRLALAELEARLRRQEQGEAGSATNADARSAAREWTSPFTDLVRRCPAAEASAMRDAAVARLVMVMGDGITLPEREPMGLLGVSNARLDAGQDAAPQAEALTALSNDAHQPTAIRAGALRALAREAMRAERWSDAADLSLRLAREHGTDPSSPAAMSLAVRIARELDRAADGQDVAARARLEAAIELAAAAFPEHADQPLWQLERQTLATEAKARSRPCRLSDTEPRAEASPDATSDWLRARRAVARAWLRLLAGDAGGALSALDGAHVTLQGSAASRRVAVRLAALAELDRDVSSDAELRSAAQASPAMLVQHAVERMGALLPSERLPLQPASTAAPDAAAARRLREALAMAQCTDATAWAAAGDLLRLRGEPQAALLAYERALAQAPDARELLLGKAEALFALGGEPRLAEAMGIHRRLLAGREMTGDAADRDRAWWLSQLRQLQTLQAANRFDERALMRMNRLKALDASLGGPAFADAFAALPRTAQPTPAGTTTQP